MSNASLEAARVAAPAAPRGVSALRAPEDDTLGCLANASSSADSLFPPRYVRTRRLSDGTLRTFLHLLGCSGNPHRCKLLLAHRHPLSLRVRQRRTTPGARFEPRALSRGGFRPPPPARASGFARSPTPRIPPPGLGFRVCRRRRFCPRRVRGQPAKGGPPGGEGDAAIDFVVAQLLRSVARRKSRVGRVSADPSAADADGVGDVAWDAAPLAAPRGVAADPRLARGGEDGFARRFAGG